MATKQGENLDVNDFGQIAIRIILFIVIYNQQVLTMSMFNAIHKRVKTQNRQIKAPIIHQKSIQSSDNTIGKYVRQPNYRRNDYPSSLQIKVQSDSRFKDFSKSIKNNQKLTINDKNQIAISSLSNQYSQQKRINKIKPISKDYQLISLIGKGTFGKILKGFAPKQRKYFAIKKIYQDERYQNRQLDILKMINHPNVIKILDYYYDIQGSKQYLYIVMDIYKSDLYKTIRQGQLDSLLMKIYLFQILKGLQYLSSQLIAHRDLKPHNILINKDTLQVVICDFGSSKRLIKTQKNISYICARSYRAPELLLGATEYTVAVDMWSFGCIMAEMVNRRIFFQASSNSEQLVQIIKLLGTPSEEDYLQMRLQILVFQNQRQPKFRKLPLKQFIFTNDAEFVDLLEKILVYSPKKRLSPAQALNHPYFSALKNKQTIRQLQIFYEYKDLYEANKKFNEFVPKTSSKNHQNSTFHQGFEPNMIKATFSDMLQKIVIPKLEVMKQKITPLIHN